MNESRSFVICERAEENSSARCSWDAAGLFYAKSRIQSKSKGKLTVRLWRKWSVVCSELLWVIHHTVWMKLRMLASDFMYMDQHVYRRLFRKYFQRNLQSSWRNAPQHSHWSCGEWRTAGARRQNDPWTTPVRTNRGQVNVDKME